MPRWRAWLLDLIGERFEEWSRVGHCQSDVECRRGWRTPFGVVWFDAPSNRRALQDKEGRS